MLTTYSTYCWAIRLAKYMLPDSMLTTYLPTNRQVLRMQSNKCPICRTGIESLLQIKISKQDCSRPEGDASPGAPAPSAAS